VIRNAIIGGGIWAALVIAGRISPTLDRSWIELLFLFATLVIVPLGLHLTRRFDGPRGESEFETALFKTSLPAAIAAVASYYFASPLLSVGCGVPWLAFAIVLAAARIWRFLKIRTRGFDGLCALVAFLYLAVGACWFLASRLGWHPIDFHEPIVLLTAVHFHYAGFAAAVLVRALSRATGSNRIRALLFPVAAAGALAGPAFLAAGFVIGPRIKLVAALLVAAGEIALAGCFIGSIRQIGRINSRLLLVVSAASVLISMCFAALWAIGEFPRQPFLDLARMAAWHGSLNAFGFTFCGLAAYIADKPAGQAGEGGTI
jgi:YndJ-like protein